MGLTFVMSLRKGAGCKEINCRGDSVSTKKLLSESTPAWPSITNSSPSGIGAVASVRIFNFLRRDSGFEI